MLRFFFIKLLKIKFKFTNYFNLCKCLYQKLNSIMYKIFSLLLVFVLTVIRMDAQYTVDGNQTATALANTLVGEGVIIMGTMLDCDTIANGIFYGIGDLGIDSGIILTSGRAETTTLADGVNGPFTYWGNPSESIGTPGDPELDNVIPPIETYDACILEFDFLPSGDTVKFDFVFASSEYGSFSCSNYNDIFAFFISGPGITGSENIAVIPGTTIPICVNSTTGVDATVATDPGCTSMGPGSPFSSYYVDNTSGLYITYGGFTTVFQAISPVSPCDTYHLKLAIADGSDGGLDSGVFLKAGSLTSVGLTMTPEGTEGGLDSDPHCIRGCKPAEIKFEIPSPKTEDLTIHYLIEGTAINGTDYSTITDSIIISAGDTVNYLTINPLLASTATGPRTVVIKALAPYVCSDGSPAILDSATVIILDSLYVNITTPSVAVCPNTDVNIVAVIDSSLNYVWTASQSVPGIESWDLDNTTRPSETTIYTITVSQPGAPATCPFRSIHYTAIVEPYPQIELPFKEITVCLEDSMDIFIKSLPYDFDFNYSFTPSTYLRNNYDQHNRFFAPPGDYNYTVTASSPLANCSTSEEFTIHVVPPFEFDWVSPSDTTINYGDTIVLDSHSEAEFWMWSPITYLSHPHRKNPLCYPEEDMVYTLVGLNKYGCSDTATVTIKVNYESTSILPSVFSPNGDGLNDFFGVEGLKYDKISSFQVFNRWGELVYDRPFDNKGWDGTFEGNPVEQGTYFYRIVLTLPDGKMKFFKGDITLVR